MPFYFEDGYVLRGPVGKANGNDWYTQDEWQYSASRRFMNAVRFDTEAGLRRRVGFCIGSSAVIRTGTSLVNVHARKDQVQDPYIP